MGIKFVGPKASVADHIANVWFWCAFLVAVGLTTVRQELWALLFWLDQKCKDIVGLGRVTGFLLNQVSYDLAENTGSKRDIPENYSKTTPKAREEALVCLNNAQRLHTTMKYVFLGTSPFWSRNVSYEVPPSELNKSSHVYMGNHTSYADFVLMTGMGLNITGVGKSELMEVPVAGKILQRGGMLPVHFIKKPNGKWGVDHAKANQMLERAKSYLLNGLSLFVFPEGKINVNEELSDFKPGFFHVAKAAGVDIVPIAILGANEVWPMAKEGVPRIPVSYGSTKIKVGRPMPVLQKELVSVKASVEEIDSLLQEKYSVALKDGEMRDLAGELVEMNSSENIGEDFEKKVDELYRLTVRERISNLKSQLESIEIEEKL